MKSANFPSNTKGFPIVRAEWLAPRVRSIIVQAPRVAAHHKPGHFVIVRAHTDGERIPLTVADADAGQGTIRLVIQAVGASTELLSRLETGGTIPDVAGPLGRPTEMERFGHVVLVGGGVGTAVIYPQAKALKQLGNRVTAIIGGRSKEYVILEEDLRRLCDAVYPCTDDGSYGYHGFVTGKLAEIIGQSEQSVGAVITAGPVPMMKAVAQATKEKNIHTVASLNPVMVDGTGMCGGCRVSVGGKQLFACVDGPEFDAHQVDFDELIDRLGAYRAQEKAAWNKLHAETDYQCRLEQSLTAK